MMTELEQLKRHVVNFDTADGSMEMVTRLERRLKEAIAGEKLADHFVIADFRKALEGEIQAIDALLTTMSTKDLPDRERQYLLDKKGLYDRFFDAFGGESRRKSIEQTIKNYLDHVQNQS